MGTRKPKGGGGMMEGEPGARRGGVKVKDASPVSVPVRRSSSLQQLPKENWQIISTRGPHMKVVRKSGACGGPSSHKLLQNGLVEGEEDGADDNHNQKDHEIKEPVADRDAAGAFTMPRLTDEVLKMILSHLTLLDDLRTAVNSHKAWRRILLPKRQLWLFPKVLPFLTPYLRRNDILKLRTVCGPWRQGVDEFIENAEHLAPYSGRSLLRHRHPGERVPVWKQTDLNFPYRIGYPSAPRFRNGSFEWVMRSHPRSPFVGRELSIGMLPSSSCDSCQPESPRIYGDVHSFLGDFGQHIYYLNLNFPAGFNFWKMHVMLKAILEKTPNLRQLRLVGEQPQTCDHQSFNVDEILIGALIGYSALPSLKTLQLEFRVNGLVTLFPLDDILLMKHSASLGRLEVKRWNPGWHCLGWNNLTDLSLPVQSSHDLRSLVKLDAPKLSRLFLTFPGDDTDADGHSELFQVLQHFPALESLGILFERCTTPIHEMSKKDTVFWLEFEEVLARNGASFPLIKILELRNAPIPLELILHFPNVQVVNILGHVDVEPVRFAVCDFSYDSKPWEYGNLHSQTGMVWIGDMDEHDPNFYETRVEDDDDQLFPSLWLQLPRLQVLTVGSRIHRREKFEKFAQRFQRLTICDFPSVFSSLLQLDLPKVKRVELQLGYNQEPLRRHDPNLSSRTFLKVLANLPNLGQLEFTCLNFAASADLLHIPDQNMTDHPPTPTMFPSVIYLKVNFLPISKGFLLRFPRLQCLEFDAVIGQRSYCKKWSDPIVFRKYKPGSYRLRSVLPTGRSYELKEIPESEVWNLVPSLELFTVNGGKGSANYLRGGGFEYIQNE